MTNIFKSIPYYNWNTPKNICSNIGLFFRRFKWAYQRATRGYADCDIWNMDQWLLELLPAALNHLADHHYGFPGDEEFPTDEAWVNYLKEIAQLFYQANELNYYYPEPQYKKWSDWYDTHKIDWNNKNTNPYVQVMLEEGKRVAKLHDTDLKVGLNKVANVFWHLWD
jgi:hypothetical protein